RRGDDQARAVQRGSPAARSRLCVPGLPAAYTGLPAASLRREGFFRSDAPVAPQRLLLSRMDEADSGGNRGAETGVARGPARSQDRVIAATGGDADPPPRPDDLGVPAWGRSPAQRRGGPCGRPSEARL